MKKCHEHYINYIEKKRNMIEYTERKTKKKKERQIDYIERRTRRKSKNENINSLIVHAVEDTQNAMKESMNEATNIKHTFNHQINNIISL